MTRLEALQALAEKVGAGDTGRQIPRSLIWAAFGMGLEISGAPIGRIFDLILDPEDMMALGAAMALHEAMLPGWDAYVSAKGRASVDPENGGTIDSEYVAGNPARAWLLAILKALIAQEQAKGDE